MLDYKIQWYGSQLGVVSKWEERIVVKPIGITSIRLSLETIRAVFGPCGPPDRHLGDWLTFFLQERAFVLLYQGS